MLATLISFGELYRYRGRGGGGAFAVIGGVVVVIVAVVLIIGPKKSKIVDKHTGLERQTLPSDTGMGSPLIAAILAGVFVLAGLYCMALGFVGGDEASRNTVEGMGIFAGLAWGAALVAGYVANWKRPLVCAAGGVMGLIMMLKPALFPISYLATWLTPPAMHTLSYTAQSHMMWITPGFLLLVLAGLLLIRYRRSL